MSPKGALALVESPAQLLNVIELGHVDPGLARVRIAVLAPTSSRARVQLRVMTSFALRVGHRVDWHEPRIGGSGIARSLRTLSGELSGVDRLVVGDPFSGAIGLAISMTRCAQVTVVDDGTATLEFARQWASGAQLSRWHRPAAAHGRQLTDLARAQLAGTVRRRLSAAAGCQLRIFSALPVTAPGVELLVNRYAWVRHEWGMPEVLSGADLAGSSLVESGVVQADPYLAGVESLIVRHGVARYFAHRNEADAKLDLIARTGVQVVRPGLPLEIVARRGPIGSRVLSFPSTVVHTLPIVLTGSGAEVLVCEIPESWYAPRAAVTADRFLGEVQTSARSAHELEAVAC